MRLLTLISVCFAAARNDVEKVEHMYREILRRYPDDALALEALADIYWKNSKIEEALPIALRMLEIESTDFLALRIAAFASFEHGDMATTYDYARRLCLAPQPSTESYDRAIRLLKPLSCIPRFSHLKHKAHTELISKRSSYQKWAQWAHDYVANYESQTNTPQRTAQ